jgi:hypothetical protein
MAEVAWEKVVQEGFELDECLWRAKVPGDWLVRTSFSVESSLTLP